jgi:hypothetical protein
MLAPLYKVPQDLKHLPEDPLSLVKIRFYNSIVAFSYMGASLAENARMVDQLAKIREGVYTVRVQGTRCHRVGMLLPVESRTSSHAQLYVFDSDMEEQVNTRCCIMADLDREIVATI